MKEVYCKVNETPGRLEWRDEQVETIEKLCCIYWLIRDKCDPTKRERLIPTPLEDIYEIATELFQTCIEGGE